MQLATYAILQILQILQLSANFGTCVSFKICKKLQVAEVAKDQKYINLFFKILNFIKQIF